MYRCIIIEDQPPAQKILQNYISKTDQLDLKGTFSDILEARTFLASHEIDLVFLDINLPKASGMELLRNEKNIPYAILTTAYSEYALESYQYNVIDYLLKPFSIERFNQAIHKMVNLVGEINPSGAAEHSDFIYVKSNHELIKVSCKDIIFIHSDADYTELVTAERKYLASESLKEWMSKLCDDFVQVHKSYIINFRHTSKISANRVKLTDSHVIPVGRAFKKGFMKRYVGD